MRGTLGLRPGRGGDVLDLPVCQVREASEYVAQVGVGIDGAATTAFDDGVEHRSALTGFGGPDEEPVFLADGGGADGVFAEVVVDLDAAIAEINIHRGPLTEGVVEGLVEEA